jgi:hypothetical protein
MLSFKNGISEEQEISGINENLAAVFIDRQRNYES